MADLTFSLSRTILFLRPLTARAVEVLHLSENAGFVCHFPRPETVQIPLGKSPGDSPTAQPESLETPQINEHGTRESRESTPDHYPDSTSVLRIGFDSLGWMDPPAQGFEFGSGPRSIVKIPYDGNKRAKAYFSIRYNFDNGAILITALDTMWVGSSLLREQQSLYLKPGMSFHCGGGQFVFNVELPDLENCVEEHWRHFKQYAANVGFPNAPYMGTHQDGLRQMGPDYQSISKLGKGTFGTVHKTLHRKSGRFFAIKTIMGGGEVALKELSIMNRLFHEHIVKYEDTFRLPDDQTCIVMELAMHDLAEQRRVLRNGQGMSMSIIRSIARQVLSGLKYLHSEGVMHRDLKPQNILVTKWDTGTNLLVVKLADFGLAGVNPEQKTYCGTEGYMAPEIIESHKRAEESRQKAKRGMKTDTGSEPLFYTNAVDIWATGIILFELMQDVPDEKTRHGKTLRVNKGPAFSLIRQMLEHDPKKRPTAAECLNNPWLAMSTANQDGVLVLKREAITAP